jgi:hypothetical protein
LPETAKLLKPGKVARRRTRQQGGGGGDDQVLHVVAIGGLIASATYAYTIKYETLYHGEQLAKLKQRSQKEREAIAVLKAEWQHLNRPDRLQMLSERHLALQPLAANQLVRFSDIPAKAPKVDDIGRKLEALGLSDDLPTASIGRPVAVGSPARARRAADCPPATPPAATAAVRVARCRRKPNRIRSRS